MVDLTQDTVDTRKVSVDSLSILWDDTQASRDAASRAVEMLEQQRREVATVGEAGRLSR